MVQPHHNYSTSEQALETTPRGMCRDHLHGSPSSGWREAVGHKATPHTQSHVQDTTRIVFQWVIVFDLAGQDTSTSITSSRRRPHSPIRSRPTHGGFYAKSEPNSGLLTACVSASGPSCRSDHVTSFFYRSQKKEKKGEKKEEEKTNVWKRTICVPSARNLCLTLSLDISTYRSTPMFHLYLLPIYRDKSCSVYGCFMDKSLVQIFQHMYLSTSLYLTIFFSSQKYVSIYEISRSI